MDLNAGRRTGGKQSATEEFRAALVPADLLRRRAQQWRELRACRCCVATRRKKLWSAGVQLSIRTCTTIGAATASSAWAPTYERLFLVGGALQGCCMTCMTFVSLRQQAAVPPHVHAISTLVYMRRQRVSSTRYTLYGCTATHIIHAVCATAAADGHGLGGWDACAKLLIRAVSAWSGPGLLPTLLEVRMSALSFCSCMLVRGQCMVQQKVVKAPKRSTAGTPAFLHVPP